MAVRACLSTRAGAPDRSCTSPAPRRRRRQCLVPRASRGAERVRRRSRPRGFAETAPRRDSGDRATDRPRRASRTSRRCPAAPSRVPTRRTIRVATSDAVGSAGRVRRIDRQTRFRMPSGTRSPMPRPATGPSRASRTTSSCATRSARALPAAGRAQARTPSPRSCHGSDGLPAPAAAPAGGRACPRTLDLICNEGAAAPGGGPSKRK